MKKETEKETQVKGEKKIAHNNLTLTVTERIVTVTANTKMLTMTVTEYIS